MKDKVEIIVNGKPVSLDYLHDREIPDRVWNTYMKKYGDQYRIIKDEIGIWHIKCKFGNIQLYSLLKHQLCFVGDFRSKQHKTYFKKKLDFKHIITQEGDTDIVIMFEERFLPLTSQCMRIYKKYNLSKERRKQLSDQMKKIRKRRLINV
jgi:hypothetical protein